MTLDPLLLDVLACPVDKGPLLWFEDEDILYNPRLKKSYRVEDGVPVMLVDEAADVSDGGARAADGQGREGRGAHDRTGRGVSRAPRLDSAGMWEAASRVARRVDGSAREGASCVRIGERRESRRADASRRRLRARHGRRRVRRRGGPHRRSARGALRGLPRLGAAERSSGRTASSSWWRAATRPRRWERRASPRRAARVSSGSATTRRWRGWSPAPACPGAKSVVKVRAAAPPSARATVSLLGALSAAGLLPDCSAEVGAAAELAGPASRCVRRREGHRRRTGPPDRPDHPARVRVERHRRCGGPLVEVVCEPQRQVTRLRRRAAGADL